MIRSGSLVALAFALSLLPQPGFAQFGGMGGGMGGGFGMPARRAYPVEIEVASGKRLSGPLMMGQVVIESDFGRYELRPEMVQSITLSPREDGSTHLNVGQFGTPIPGTITTTSDEEITGDVFVPEDWTVTTELGTLTLSPTKLRSITFTSGGNVEGEAEAAAERFSQMRRDLRRSAVPQMLEIGRFQIAISASGDKLVARDTQSGETATLELLASAEEPLRVTTLASSGLVALHIEGENIRKLAALSLSDGKWYPIDLVEPVQGKASPVASAEVVYYQLGRRLYAFSAKANRWDVLETPEGVSSFHSASNAALSLRYSNGSIHKFSAETGKWTHTNVQDLLGEPSVEAENVEAEDATPTDSGDNPEAR